MTSKISLSRGVASCEYTAEVQRVAIILVFNFCTQQVSIGFSMKNAHVHSGEKNPNSRPIRVLLCFVSQVRRRKAFSVYSWFAVCRRRCTVSEEGLSEHPAQKASLKHAELIAPGGVFVPSACSAGGPFACQDYFLSFELRCAVSLSSQVYDKSAKNEGSIRGVNFPGACATQWRGQQPITHRNARPSCKVCGRGGSV